MTAYNNSGRGWGSSVPAEVKRWNWGAFLLGVFWGIGNGVFSIALLGFLPVVGWIMPFVFGAKGNEWAWQNTRWDSIEHFRRVQRRWATWGMALAPVVGVVLVWVVLFAFPKDRDSGWELGGRGGTANDILRILVWGGPALFAVSVLLFFAYWTYELFFSPPYCRVCNRRWRREGHERDCPKDWMPDGYD